MPIRHPLDTSMRVSLELAQTLETLVSDPDSEPPQTLVEARAALLGDGGAAARETGLVQPLGEDSPLAELDALIEAYGADAPVLDFVATRASDALSRVIEAAIDDVGLPDEPTLGLVRAAMMGGLSARLVGEGAIDEDDEGALLDEIDDLVVRYGEDTPAETFVRFD